MDQKYNEIYNCHMLHAFSYASLQKITKYISYTGYSKLEYHEFFLVIHAENFIAKDNYKEAVFSDMPCIQLRQWTYDYITSMQIKSQFLVEY